MNPNCYSIFFLNGIWIKKKHLVFFGWLGERLLLWLLFFSVNSLIWFVCHVVVAVGAAAKIDRTTCVLFFYVAHLIEFRVIHQVIGFRSECVWFFSFIPSFFLVMCVCVRVDVNVNIFRLAIHSSNKKKQQISRKSFQLIFFFQFKIIIAFKSLRGFLLKIIGLTPFFSGNLDGQ